MRPNAAAHRWRTSLARSAVFRVAGVLIVGLVVWLGLFAGDGLPGSAISLVAVPTLAGLVGVAWYLPRARAEKRWQAALSHYGEQELARQGASHPEDVPPPGCPYQVEGRLLTRTEAVICTLPAGSCHWQEVRAMTGGRHTAVCRLRDEPVNDGRPDETA